MKAISVRNVSDMSYEAMRQLSAQNHRSLQEQVRTLIDREARLVMASQPLAGEGWRQRLAGRKLANTVEDVRNDRARGAVADAHIAVKPKGGHVGN